MEVGEEEKDGQNAAEAVACVRRGEGGEGLEINDEVGVEEHEGEKVVILCFRGGHVEGQIVWTKEI